MEAFNTSGCAEQMEVTPPACPARWSATSVAMRFTDVLL
jgi:hypothetical protein